MELRWLSDTDSWTFIESQVSKSKPVSKRCSSTSSIHWNFEAPKIPYLHKTFSAQGQRNGLPPCILSQSDHPAAEGEHTGSSTSWLVEGVCTNHGFCEKPKVFTYLVLFLLENLGHVWSFYHALSCCTEAAVIY